MGEPLRRIDLESFPHIRSKLVTVVLVPQDGEPIYAVTVGRKRELLRAYRKGDALIATLARVPRGRGARNGPTTDDATIANTRGGRPTWLGRYSAGAFLVDADALSEWAAALID